MQMVKYKRSLKILIKKPGILFKRTSGYVFIVSHMRSYSTLLSHIFGSHPQIAGYSELHIPYKDRHDLINMRYKVSETIGREQISQKFLLDKILHNYEISQAVMNRDDVHVLFLLRDPESTLKSILNMGLNLTTSLEWCRSPDTVLTYYQNRLNQIESISKMLNKRALLLEANDLLFKTEPVLNLLTHWLQLEVPLQEEYKSFDYTGVGGYGDRSEKIKKGKIDRQKNSYPHIQLPPAILESAQLSYESCLNTLQQHSDSLPEMG